MSSDPRFARLATDPRFRRPKASKHKVVVDERFKQLFDDSNGSSGSSKSARKVDKYGRPLAKEATVNELKRYYRLASPEAEALKKGEEAVEGDQEGDQEGDESEEDGEDEENEDEEKKVPAGQSFVDLARGTVLLESSDEEGSDNDEALASDAESTSSSAAGAVTLGGRKALRRVSRSPSIDLSETEPTAFPEEEEDEFGEEDEEEDAEATRRVALVNLDWDHLRASDLYRVLSSALSATATGVQEPSKHHKVKYDADGNELESYKPSAKLTIAPGRVRSVRIYPSQFGRERLEREAIEGPPAAVLKAKGAESSDDEEGDGKTLKLGRKKNKGKKRRGEGSDEDITERDLVDEQLQDGEEDYDTEALRKYQLERLRYYYAVATFDTPAAALHVVQQINGSEFERTANIFDLQFVPDETSFDDDPVHDEATEATIAAEGNSYQGLDFATDALRHSKVKLTWDADDPHRKTKMQTYLAAALDRSKQKGATKGRPKIGEADIEQYLASSSEEEGAIGKDEEEEEEEQDDFFEAAAEEVPELKKGKKASKRDRMRALLGLGGEEDGDAEVSWDGGKKSSKGGDAGMQITFAPALSEQSAKQLEFGGDEKQETSIERYKRKEKERKERKKAERKARMEGRLSDDGEGAGECEIEPAADGGDDLGFDDDFFAEDAADPFAADDAGGMDSGDEIGVKSSKKQAKKDKKAQREAQEAADAKEQAELALLVDSDDEDALGENGEGGRHFDMRQILKAEKNKGKKHKVKGKSKKAAKEQEVVKDDFELDLKDDRFKSLHEDFDYAIDPSNPRFQKSRNMDALLAEGRKRRAVKSSKVRAPVVPTDGTQAPKRPRSAEDGSESLSKLVEAVKRKAGETGGRGKRAKTG